MTRRSTFRSIKLNYVSCAALTVGVWTSPHREAESSEATLSLLARFGIGLRFIFGLHSERYMVKAEAAPDYNPTRHQKRASAHRQKRHISGRKHPAHDLEILMCFAPGSCRGLTLNQYRERFTRISVMGRTQIYVGFFKRLSRLRRAAMKDKLDIEPLYQAPLRPD